MYVLAIQQKYKRPGDAVHAPGTTGRRGIWENERVGMWVSEMQPHLIIYIYIQGVIAFWAVIQP